MYKGGGALLRWTRGARDHFRAPGRADACRARTSVGALGSPRIIGPVMGSWSGIARSSGISRRDPFVRDKGSWSFRLWWLEEICPLLGCEDLVAAMAEWVSVPIVVGDCARARESNRRRSGFGSSRVRVLNGIFFFGIFLRRASVYVSTGWMWRFGNFSGIAREIER